MLMAKVPRQFKVLSTQPELKIRYVDRIGEKMMFFLLFFPFILIFSEHIRILLSGLYEIFHLRLWTGIQILSYGSGNPWHIMWFILMFGFGVPSWLVIWQLLGQTEIRASHDMLTISYRLLWLSHEIFCGIRDIEYFNQLSRKGSEGEIYWELEIVTNRNISRKFPTLPVWMRPLLPPEKTTQKNHQIIYLYYHSTPEPIHWLGNILADFYSVRFQPIVKSEHTT